MTGTAPEAVSVSPLGPITEAAMHADAMLDKGDLDGRRVWLRILAAVNELLDTRAADEAEVH